MTGYTSRDTKTAMYRFKQLIRLKPSLQSDNAQLGELQTRMKIMNKVIGLGIPVRQQFN